MPKGQGKMTTAQWVTLAIAKHGLKYDYSDSEYTGSIYKITIGCPTHGEFSQNARSHLDGRGCPTCGKEQSAAKQTISPEVWIEKAKAVHSDLYDYSETEYTHSLEPVVIRCKIHGPFEQIATIHLRGSGCQKCGADENGDRETHSTQRVTTEEFLRRASAVHGETYDYTKTEYESSNVKLTITCRIHGDFMMLPNIHVKQKSGCIVCGRLSSAKLRAHTKEWFIEEASKVHGDGVYDYSRVSYVNIDTMVDIVCKEHGIYQQAPYNHLQGQKCPGCANRIRYNTQTFIAAAVRVHGDRYNYSETDYASAHDFVTISCDLHGDFQQKAYSHLAGKGCGRCGQCANSSKPQIQWLEWVAVKEQCSIEHAENKGEFRIPGSRYLADGYCRETNTVMEYHGGFYHGEPRQFAADEYNKKLKKTFGDLHKETLKKEKYIESLGFRLVTMWELDWKNIVVNIQLIQKVWRQHACASS